MHTMVVSVQHMSPLNTGLYLLPGSEQVHKIQQSFTPSHTVNRLQSLERPTLAEKISYSHEAFRHVFLLPSFVIYGHILETLDISYMNLRNASSSRVP